MKSISKIAVVDINGSQLAIEPELILSDQGTPGVTVTDTLIKIDISVVQFSNINESDSNTTSAYRRLRLDSDRQSVYTTPELGQRFLVGIPPVIKSYELNSTVPGDTNFRRDVQKMTLNGMGLQLANQIELVDQEGQVIVPAGQILIPHNDIIVAPDGESIVINGSAFSQNGSKYDSGMPRSRRIVVKTPWGTSYSDANASGAFSMTATPIISQVASQVYAGVGLVNGNTYDINATTGSWPNNLNPLNISGNNMLGVSTISGVNTPESVYFTLELIRLIHLQGSHSVTMAQVFLYQEDIFGKMVMAGTIKWASQQADKISNRFWSNCLHSIYYY